MKHGKGRESKDNSDTPKILWFTLKAWIIGIVSFTIDLILLPIGSELAYALTQKAKPNDEAFFWFLLVLGFVSSAIGIFTFLYAFITFIERRRRNQR